MIIFQKARRNAKVRIQKSKSNKFIEASSCEWLELEEKSKIRSETSWNKWEKTRKSILILEFLIN